MNKIKPPQVIAILLLVVFGAWAVALFVAKNKTSTPSPQTAAVETPTPAPLAIVATPPPTPMPTPTTLEFDKTNNVVMISPNPPIAGETVIIMYNAKGRPLENSEEIRIHIFPIDNEKGWLQVPMIKQSDFLWKGVWKIPPGKDSLNFAFENQNREWDNNNKMDWSFPISLEISELYSQRTALNIEINEVRKRLQEQETYKVISDILVSIIANQSPTNPSVLPPSLRKDLADFGALDSAIDEIVIRNNAVVNYSRRLKLLKDNNMNPEEDEEYNNILRYATALHTQDLVLQKSLDEQVNSLRNELADLIQQEKDLRNVIRSMEK